jgi:acyl-CoA thioester hydrolase
MACAEVSEVVPPSGERVLCHRVRYHETDAQHIVFNARYLEWVDVAMAEFFRRGGWDYRALIDAGCDPSLVSAKLEFKRPAVFDDELDVFVRPLHVGRSSFTLDFDIYRASDGEHLAVAEIVYVNVDVATQRSRPLPDPIRSRLEAHLRPEPSAHVA